MCISYSTKQGVVTEFCLRNKRQHLQGLCLLSHLLPFTASLTWLLQVKAPLHQAGFRSWIPCLREALHLMIPQALMLKPAYTSHTQAGLPPSSS